MQVRLNEVRYLIEALCSMAGEVVGVVVEDGKLCDTDGPGWPFDHI